MAMRSGLVVCLLVLGSSGRAVADARTAEILMGECQKHFNAMEYELAASKCEAALRADATVVGAMRYLAVINRALGKKTGEPRHYQQCIAWAEMYLRERPTGKFTDRMRDEINACRKALGQRELPKIDTQGQTGALVITCDVDGATVTIDDLKRGGTPMNPVQVTPGRHTVTVYKYGYLPFTTTVDVVTKQIHEVKVALVRDPNAPLEPASRPVGPGEPSIERGVVRVECAQSPIRVFVDGKSQTLTADGSFDYEPGIHVVRVEADGYDTWERRVAVVRGQIRDVKVKLRPFAARTTARKWAWTLTAVAAATAASGVTCGLLENRSFNRAEDLYQQGRRGLQVPDLRQKIGDAKTQGDRYKIISSVSIAVSLTALAGAVFFWIREHGDERPAGEPPALALQPTLWPGGAGLVFARGFGR
ncbi:MAG: PEGA domain-containing protein [Deltaproteobacteria bacterium]|nr:PEGA domain-containing protein [Deltaproteobacteria bacterium]